MFNFSINTEYQLKELTQHFKLLSTISGQTVRDDVTEMSPPSSSSDDSGQQVLHAIAPNSDESPAEEQHTDTSVDPTLQETCESSPDSNI